MSVLFASISLCGAFSGLLAAAIEQIGKKSGRPGWAWIFILVRYADCFVEYTH